MTASGHLNPDQFGAKYLALGKGRIIAPKEVRGRAASIVDRLSSDHGVPAPRVVSGGLRNHNVVASYFPEHGAGGPVIGVSTWRIGEGNIEHTMLHEFTHHLEHLSGRTSLDPDEAHGQAFMDRFDAVHERYYQ